MSELPPKIGRRVANAVLKLTGGSKLYSHPGHFYSPVVNPDEAIRYVRDLERRETCQIVNPETVCTTFARLSRHFPRSREILSSGNHRFVETNNVFFSLGEACIYSAFISELRPKLIIEVGTGYSSACALDTVEQLQLPTEFVFIDPNPERLFRLISPADRSRVTILQKGVQDVSVSVFDQLEAGDILFLDTTHVFKTGSDVAHELFEILPRLKPNVIVHFHDIFDQWEYPVPWIIENRSWNEIYALRAFLMFNTMFEVVYFNDFMSRHFQEQIDQTDLREMYTGSGLYLRRL